MPERLHTATPTYDAVTNYIAAGSVVSFLWLPTLQSVSTIAAEMLPILGCAWLLVQLALRLLDNRRDRKRRAEEEKDME